MSAFGYSMPSYFQNMPQLGTPLQAANEENEKTLREVEAAYNAEVEATLAAGRSDESLNQAGQMPAGQPV